jgi:hypothetical protein
LTSDSATGLNVNGVITIGSTGASGAGYGPYQFYGSIDEVRIYKSMISSTDIMSIFNSIPITSTPEVYLQFSPASGSPAYILDSSPTGGHHLVYTATNVPVYELDNTLCLTPVACNPGTSDDGIYNNK